MTSSYVNTGLQERVAWMARVAELQARPLGLNTQEGPLNRAPCGCACPKCVSAGCEAHHADFWHNGYAVRPR